MHAAHSQISIGGPAARGVNVAGTASATVLAQPWQGIINATPLSQRHRAQSGDKEETPALGAYPISPTDTDARRYQRAPFVEREIHRVYTISVRASER